MGRISKHKDRWMVWAVVGWTAYAFGWIVWFGALPLKADYESPPQLIVKVLMFMIMGDCAVVQRSRDLELWQ